MARSPSKLESSGTAYDAPPQGAVLAASQWSSSLTARMRERAKKISPDTWALLAIAAAVLFANLPYLAGLVEANPLGPRSGLLSSVSPGFVRGQPWIDPNTGFTSQALGHLAALDLLHLHFPWWNPYEGAGAPLLGEMQSAALFPPTLLTIFSNGQLYEHILLELVAGCATYLLLRRLSLGRWACLAAGIAFAMNGTFGWLSHATVNPVAFLPLLLLGIELAYGAAAQGRHGGWWLIAVAGALSFYAGFPEVAYIDTLLAIVWFGWRCACLERQRLPSFAIKAALGAAVATALSAPLLIAWLEYSKHGYLAAHASNYLGSVHIDAHGLPALLLPYVYGPIFGFADPNQVLTTFWGSVGGYLSTSLLLFAVLGAFSPGRRGLRITLLVWILLVFSRIYGEPPLLGHVLGVLPGMSKVEFFRYATASLELAVIILAALGLDEVIRAPVRRRRVAWAALGTLAIVVAAAVGARPLAHQLGSAFQHRPYFIGSIVWGAALVAAGALAALVRDARARAVMVSLVLAVDVVALFMFSELAAPRQVRTDLAPAAYLQSHLGTSRFFTLGPLQPNYGSYFGIASLNINDSPIPSNFEQYIHTRLDQWAPPNHFVGNEEGGRSPLAPPPAAALLRNLAGYREAGVAYLLVPAGQVLGQSPTGFQLVDRTPSTWIYHLSGASPFFTAADRRCDIKTESVDALQITCPSPTVITRRETYLPGSNAQVDGHSATVRQVDGLFQSVAVPAGTHRVTFGYVPPKIGWGLLAFAAGVLALLATLLGAAGRLGAIRGRFRR